MSSRPRRTTSSDPADRLEPPDGQEWRPEIAHFDFVAERGEELSGYKYRFCSACGSYKLKQLFTPQELKKNAGSRLCLNCSTSGGHTRRGNFSGPTCGSNKTLAHRLQLWCQQRGQRLTTQLSGGNSQGWYESMLAQRGSQVR